MQNIPLKRRRSFFYAFKIAFFLMPFFAKGTVDIAYSRASANSKAHMIQKVRASPKTPTVLKTRVVSKAITIPKASTISNIVGEATNTSQIGENETHIQQTEQKAKTIQTEIGKVKPVITVVHTQIKDTQKQEQVQQTKLDAAQKKVEHEAEIAAQKGAALQYAQHVFQAQQAAIEAQKKQVQGLESQKTKAAGQVVTDQQILEETQKKVAALQQQLMTTSQLKEEQAKETGDTSAAAAAVQKYKLTEAALEVAKKVASQAQKAVDADNASLQNLGIQLSSKNIVVGREKTNLQTLEQEVFKDTAAVTAAKTVLGTADGNVAALAKSYALLAAQTNKASTSLQGIQTQEQNEEGTLSTIQGKITTETGDISTLNNTIQLGETARQKLAQMRVSTSNVDAQIKDVQIKLQSTPEYPQLAVPYIVGMHTVCEYGLCMPQPLEGTRYINENWLPPTQEYQQLQTQLGYLQQVQAGQQSSQQLLTATQQLADLKSQLGTVQTQLSPLEQQVKAAQTQYQKALDQSTQENALLVQAKNAARAAQTALQNAEDAPDPSSSQIQAAKDQLVNATKAVDQIKKQIKETNSNLANTQLKITNEEVLESQYAGQMSLEQDSVKNNTTAAAALQQTINQQEANNQALVRAQKQEAVDQKKVQLQEGTQSIVDKDVEEAQEKLKILQDKATEQIQAIQQGKEDLAAAQKQLEAEKATASGDMQALEMLQRQVQHIQEQLLIDQTELNKLQETQSATTLQLTALQVQQKKLEKAIQTEISVLQNFRQEADRLSQQYTKGWVQQGSLSEYQNYITAYSALMEEYQQHAQTLQALGGYTVSSLPAPRAEILPPQPKPQPQQPQPQIQPPQPQEIVQEEVSEPIDTVNDSSEEAAVEDATEDERALVRAERRADTNAQGIITPGLFDAAGAQAVTGSSTVVSTPTSPVPPTQSTAVAP